MLVYGLLFLAVVALQIGAGAYAAERGNYPDEAAHFMNGLLIRDYLIAGAGYNPLAFAEQYYINYPKIAPLIWPPLFHVLLGLSMVPLWTPHTAALVLVAIATTWIGWRLFLIASRWTSPFAGAIVAGTFLFTAAIIDLTSVVMLDIVVAAFALEATCWFAKFMTSERVRHAVLFGVFAACCCLTKANGVSIVLVPPIAILLTRRLGLVRQRGLWLAALIVAAGTVPLLTLSYVLDTTSGGNFAFVTSSQVVGRFEFYSEYLWRQLGTLAIAFASIGALTGLFARRERDEQSDMVSALTALVVAGLAFHILNPALGQDGRWVTLAIAPLLALVPTGAAAIVAQLRLRRFAGAAMVALLALVIVNFVTVKPAAMQREPLGFRELVKRLQTQSPLAGRRMLIVSEEKGEGALVAEVAALPSPASRATIIRGTKLLGVDEWDGENFHPSFLSSEALLRELQDLYVDYVVVDRAAPPRYLRPMDELIRRNPQGFQKLFSVSTETRELTTYRLTNPAIGDRKRIRIHVTALRRFVQEQ